MKHNKSLVAASAILSIISLAAGCSVDEQDVGTPSVYGSGSSTVSSGGFESGTSSATSSGVGGGAAAPEGGSGGSGQGTAGVLTAGVWDDNLNFDRFLDYRAATMQSFASGVVPLSVEEHEAAFAAATSSARETLDISLVIDTTGSMGDEIAYLQAEFTALSNTIAERYPSAAQRWSLVAYRDEGDAYVVQSTDFTADTSAFKLELSKLSGGGGGDFPEAPDQGLERANQLEWRMDGGTARLAFLVADAPHHDHRAEAMAAAIRQARDSGIHIYPVASSGIDELTELSFRQAAQLTGGRYVFLTDDSGVGGAHKAPTIPCYYVTHLDDAILRMVDIEMGGAYIAPEEGDVIRTTGDPQDGVCTLGEDDTAVAF